MTFGEKMRALMAERGMSLRRLAAATFYDVGHLSRISRDLKPPSAKLAQELDDALGADGELVTLAVSPAPRPLGTTLTPDDKERVTQVVRRPSRLDVGTLNALATVLAGQRRLEDAVGPTALLGPVTGQLDALVAMLRDASGPLRDRLGRFVAEWTVYAGWLHAAVRQDGQALNLFAQGEDLGDDFADGTIAGIATSFRGYVARQQGRPRAVVRASSAALATPGGHPVQRTFDQLQAAQGYAALGEIDQARRLLDTATERAADDIEPPPPVYWYSEPFFQLNIGMIHNNIGEYGDAAALLNAGLTGMPADQAEAEWLDEYKAALAQARDRA
ncbi:helix-turn-helix domain-containing protein [Actinomadura sp. 9N407]|uniref:helix-turn-helix domain-containing protein n=1 Tax=Actinomadura sp. 9N407 TaxID=3375154 RepID=UPI003791890B